VIFFCFQNQLFIFLFTKRNIFRILKYFQWIYIKLLKFNFTCYFIFIIQFIYFSFPDSHIHPNGCFCYQFIQESNNYISYMFLFSFFYMYSTTLKFQNLSSPLYFIYFLNMYWVITSFDFCQVNINI